MKIYVVLRETECYCDSLHIIGVTTKQEAAEHIVAVTGDVYAPSWIEVFDTDTITPDTLLKYQVYMDRGELFCTYVGDEPEDDDPYLKSEIVYAHNHEEAIDLAKKQRHKAL